MNRYKEILGQRTPKVLRSALCEVGRVPRGARGTTKRLTSRAVRRAVRREVAAAL